MAISMWQPIYEWHLIRPGRPDVVSRSARHARGYRRIAEALGYTVERKQVGLRLKPAIARQVMRDIQEAGL